MRRRWIMQDNLEDFGTEEVGETSCTDASSIDFRGRVCSSGIVTVGKAFLRRQFSPLHGLLTALIVSVRAMNGVAIETHSLVALHDSEDQYEDDG